MKLIQNLTEAQQSERDAIIFGDYAPPAPSAALPESQLLPYKGYLAGIRLFGERHGAVVTAEKLELLISKGYADPSDQANRRPSMRQFITFMKKVPGSSAIGHAVPRSRPDMRVSVDGVQFIGTVDPATLHAFTKFAGRLNPDESVLRGQWGADHLRLWWD